jgi:hypothetical protein
VRLGFGSLCGVGFVEGETTEAVLVGGVGIALPGAGETARLAGAAVVVALFVGLSCTGGALGSDM